MLRICSIILLVGLLAGSGAAQGLAGKVRVVDGDTLVIAGERIRLYGIDAPELDQTCRRGDGQSWPCGKAARAALAGLVADAALTCTGRMRDRYGRLVAVCRVAENDLAEELVRQGAAFAYRRYAREYIAAEAAALGGRRGVWQGAAVAPEVYRAGGDTAAPGCDIKGNISRSGQIYHVPGGRDYGATHIEAETGERWFCSPAQAEAAGWRGSRR